MDLTENDTEHLFLLPVALIFENELGSNDLNEYGYNYTTTTTANVGLNQSKQNWRMGKIASEPQRPEKIGDVIRNELKWTYIFHTYGFGCLFFILAFYTFFSVLNIRSFISSRPFMSTINGFLCLLGASRAASLFIDPYNLKENMPRLFGQVLWDLGFPSIISAFSLVQLAFLQFTQFQVGPEGLRRKSCLSLVVTAHFLLTIAVDIVVASHENLMIVKHVIHYIFLTWGVFLCSSFLYSGYKIMSTIKNLPEGLKHRDFSNVGYKGIMQLGKLAPHNNLAGSMTAALLPTLCAPKIHQQDNTNVSSVGFKSDGNSRILESESIPMLEELIGSSGDDICSKPLVRASSFQNQTRISQKFNLKPKLYFESISDNSKADELSEKKHMKEAMFAKNSPKDQKDHLPKSEFVLPVESNESIINSSDEIVMNKENFVKSYSFGELKRKLERRTCFENENFCFSHEKKKQQTYCADGLVPEIMVSRLAPAEKATESEDEKSLTKLMSQISKDLNEMEILREEEFSSADAVEAHESIRKTCNDERESNSTQSQSKVAKCRGGRRGGASEGKRNKLWEGLNRSTDCSDPCAPETTISSKGSSTINSTVKIVAKFEETSAVSQKVKGKRKAKCLSWKKRLETEEEEATQECLLLQQQSTDVDLRSALSHVACMHKESKNSNCDDDFDKIRKSKVEWVLNITYVTAMWGLMLCLSYMGKIYSPFGLPEPRRVASRFNSTHSQGETPTGSINGGIPFSPWPWLWFQTFCRALELAMGCAMANITRQPTANRGYPRALTFRRRDTFYNI